CSNRGFVIVGLASFIIEDIIASQQDATSAKRLSKPFSFASLPELGLQALQIVKDRKRPTCGHPSASPTRCGQYPSSAACRNTPKVPASSSLATPMCCAPPASKSE